MQTSSWFLSFLNGSIPKDILEKDYPELDAVNFVMDNPDDLWSKQSIKNSYKKPDGTPDEKHFLKDYQLSADQFKYYELAKSMGSWTNLLTAQSGQEENKFDDGGKIETPSQPVFHEHSLIAAAMGLPTTPNFSRVQVGVSKGNPYQVKNVNGEDINLLDFYSQYDLANRNILNPKTGETEANTKTGLVRYFDRYFNPRVISKHEDPETHQMVNDLDQNNEFYMRDVKSGEDVKGVGMDVASAWGNQKKGGDLNGFLDYTQFLGSSALSAMNNTLFSALGAVADYPQSAFSMFGMDSAKDWMENLKTQFEISKVKNVSEYGQEHLFSTESIAPMAMEMASQLIGARGIGKQFSKIPKVGRFAPQVTNLVLAGMTASDIKQAVENGGGSDKMASAVWASSYLGFWGLNALTSKWLTKGLTNMQQREIYKQAVTGALKDSGSSVMADIEQGLLKPEVLGNKISNKFIDILKKVKNNSYAIPVVNESAEEMGEQQMEQLGAWMPYFLDETKLYDAVKQDNEARAYRYVDDNYNLTQHGKSMLLAGIAGGAGGATAQFLGRKIFKDIKDPQIQSLLWYQSQGKLDELESVMDDVHEKGQMGSTKIGWHKKDGTLGTIVPGKEPEYVSMNDFLHMSMKAKIDQVKGVWDNSDFNQAWAKLKLVNTSLESDDIAGLKFDTVQAALKENDVSKMMFENFQKLYDGQVKLADQAKTRKDDNDQKATEKTSANIDHIKKNINDILTGHYNDVFYRNALFNTLMSPALHKGVPLEDLHKYGMIPTNTRMTLRDYEFLNRSFEDGQAKVEAENTVLLAKNAENHVLNNESTVNLLGKNSIKDVLSHLGIGISENTTTDQLNGELEKSDILSRMRMYGFGTSAEHQAVLNHLIKIRKQSEALLGGVPVQQALEEATNELNQNSPDYLDGSIEEILGIKALDSIIDQLKDNNVQQPVNVKDFIAAEYFKLTSDKKVNVIGKKPSKFSRRWKAKFPGQKKPTQNKFSETVDLDMRKFIDNETSKLATVGDKNYNDDQKLLSTVIASIDQRITQAWANSTVLPQSNLYAKTINPAIVKLLSDQYISAGDIVNAKKKIIEDINSKTKENIDKDHQLKVKKVGLDLFYTFNGNDLELDAASRDSLIQKLVDLKNRAQKLKEISDANGYTFRKQEDDKEKEIIVAKMDAIYAAISGDSPIAEYFKDMKIDSVISDIRTLAGSENPDLNVLFNSVLELEDQLFSNLEGKRNEILSKLWNAYGSLKRQNSKLESNTKYDALTLANISKSDLNTVEDFNLTDTDGAIKDMLANKVAATQNTFNYFFQTLTVNSKHFYRHASDVMLANQFVSNENLYFSREQMNAAHLAVAFKKNQDFSWYGKDFNRAPHSTYDINGNITPEGDRNFFYKYSLAVLGTVGSGKTSVIALTEAVSNIIDMQFDPDTKQAQTRLSTTELTRQHATPFKNDVHGIVYHVDKAFTLNDKKLSSGSYFKLVDAGNGIKVVSVDKGDVPRQVPMSRKQSIVFTKNEKVKRTFEDTIGKYNVYQQATDIRDLGDLVSLLEDMGQRPINDIKFDTIYVDEVTLFSDAELFGNYFTELPENYNSLSAEERGVEVRKVSKGLLELVDKLNATILAKDGVPIKVIFTGDLEQDTHLNSSIDRYESSKIMKSDPMSIRRRTGRVTLVEFMDKLDNASKLARTHFYTYKDPQGNSLLGLTADQAEVIEFSHEGEYFAEDKMSGIKFYAKREDVKEDIDRMTAIVKNSPTPVNMLYIIGDKDVQENRSRIFNLYGGQISLDQIVTVDEAQGRNDIHFVVVDAEDGIDLNDKAYAMSYYKKLNSAVGRARYFAGVVSPQFTDRWTNSKKQTEKSIRIYSDEKRDKDFIEYYNERLTSMNTKTPSYVLGSNTFRSAPGTVSSSIVFNYDDYSTPEQVVSKLEDIFSKRSFTMSDDDWDSFYQKAQVAYNNSKSGNGSFQMQLNSQLNGNPVLLQLNPNVINLLNLHFQAIDSKVYNVSESNGMVTVTGMEIMMDKAIKSAINMVFGSRNNIGFTPISMADSFDKTDPLTIGFNLSANDKSAVKSSEISMVLDPLDDWNNDSFQKAVTELVQKELGRMMLVPKSSESYFTKLGPAEVVPVQVSENAINMYNVDDVDIKIENVDGERRIIPIVQVNGEPEYVDLYDGEDILSTLDDLFERAFPGKKLGDEKIVSISINPIDKTGSVVVDNENPVPISIKDC